MAGLYFHIPFCASKCIYCGFYSVINRALERDYLLSLHQEMDLRKEYLNGASISTIYFGGGTPSLLSINTLEDILEHIRKNFTLVSALEITIEANPEQLTLEYCQQLRAIGINRLSIGVQSFQDDVLRFMGRRHNAEDAIAAIHNAKEAGFSNISIDLIYGVAERDDARWQQDVDTALSMPIQHLSCYALTPEENSILYKQIQNRKHAPVDDEQAARQYDILIKKIEKSPFEHYEVSNFAIPGYESKHNSSYWDHTPYLGFGPAAHSFNGSSRQWNPANLKQYIENIAQKIDNEEKEELSADDLYNESILLGLRTREGIDLQSIGLTYGQERASQLLQHFRQHVDAAFFEEKENRLRLTEAGYWFADGIAADAFHTN